MGSSTAERQKHFKANMEAQGYIYTSLYISKEFNQEIKRLMFERGFKKHEAVDYIFKSYQQPPEQLKLHEPETISEPPEPDRLIKIEEILKEHDNKLNILFEKIAPAAQKKLTVKTNDDLFTEPVQDQQPDLTETDKEIIEILTEPVSDSSDWIELETTEYYQTLKEIRDTCKGIDERLAEVKKRKIKRKTRQGYSTDWNEKNLFNALKNTSKYI